MVVHTPFPATLARVKNMSSILYTPIKRSITASGSPTELNIMFKLKMPAIATEGVLRVVEINDKCDEQYGDQLLKYINDKNIEDIQLSKKEYVTMINSSDSHVAEYHCVKKIWDPEELRKTDERNHDPNILTGKDVIYAFYKLMGMEIDYDEIFAD